MAGPTTKRRGALLVVDDDDEFLRLLSETLSTGGFLVEAVAGVQEACTAARAVAFDAALLDLNLAHDSGLDLLERLRQACATTEIVLMSGHASVPAAVEAMRRGALDFVEKPLDLGRLEAILDRAVERARLVRENEALRSHVRALSGIGPIVPPEALGPALRRVWAEVDRLAPLEVPVIVSGESGVGKGLVARGLHDRSPRAAFSWIGLSCGALPPDLVLPELLGRGAEGARPGLLELAHGGTLFLDEVADLALAAQAALVGYLEAGEVRRVGSSEVRRPSARIVASTSRDLPTALRAGRIRADLLQRLGAATVVVPPLRDRREDVPVFVAHFLRLRGEEEPFPPEVVAALARREWRGNLSELRSAIDQLLLLGRPSRATVAALEALTPARAAPRTAQGARGPSDDDDLSLAANERRLVVRALERHGGNRARAARALGIDPRTLQRRVKELGLDAAPPPPLD